MKGLRKILRVSWTAKKTNEWVLNQGGVKRELLDTVKARTQYNARQYGARGAARHRDETRRIRCERTLGGNECTRKYLQKIYNLYLQKYLISNRF